jgi:hypothetical protein
MQKSNRQLRAAGLAIKRIQQDIKERGQVDPELLKELGWTKTN